MRRSLLSVIAISALALVGCGEAEPNASSEDTPAVSAEDAKSTSLEEITVEGEPGSLPEVSFAAPLVIAESGHLLVVEGDGAPVEEGQQITAHMTVVSGSSGDVYESTVEGETPAGFPANTDDINPALYDAVIDQTVGSRVLFSMDGSYGGGQALETIVYVIDILAAEDIPDPLTRAEGEEVDLPDGLPAVTRDDDGSPSIAQPEGEAPEELLVEPVIQGDGAVIEAGQKVTVHYTGWLWDDASAPFDSSWDRGEPFPVEGVGSAPVIEGWNEALVGQQVGSQIIVVIPPEKGYGESGSAPSIPGNATLVFVIDILSAIG